MRPSAIFGASLTYFRSYNHRFQVQDFLLNEKIHVRHILCESFQGKCKFVENIACVHDLSKISYIAVKCGLIKGYHEVGEGKGKFLVTATARLNNYTGYFWGFHDKLVYKFHVNQIQFIFELAFDRNKKHYP